MKKFVFLAWLALVVVLVLLSLPKGVFLVGILKVSFIEARPFNGWLQYALKAGLHEKCRWPQICGYPPP